MLLGTQIRAGYVLELNGTLFRVMNVTHLTPGNKRGIIQTQLRNLFSGNQEERRFSSDEKVVKAHLDQNEVEYLYSDDTCFYFMNTTTYEQSILDKEMIGDSSKYLLPNCKVSVSSYEGRAIGLELPKTVILTITEADPAVKNGTAAATYKSAVVETGLSVKVPEFVEVGQKIKVDTETGDYVERV